MPLTVLLVMMILSGAATLLVGLRAPRLGLPLWLGRTILVAGGAVALAGVIGAFSAFLGA